MIQCIERSSCVIHRLSWWRSCLLSTLPHLPTCIFGSFTLSTEWSRVYCLFQVESLHLFIVYGFLIHPKLCSPVCCWKIRHLQRVTLTVFALVDLGIRGSCLWWCFWPRTYRKFKAQAHWLLEEWVPRNNQNKNCAMAIPSGSNQYQKAMMKSCLCSLCARNKQYRGILFCPFVKNFRKRCVK